MTREKFNELGAQILDACIEVHRQLGPGLLESVYIYALKVELELRGIKSAMYVPVPLFYKGHNTGKLYEIDLLIEDEIVFEGKAVESMHPLFEAQIISYLKLFNRRLGYLVNFNVVRLKDGFRRFVNNF